MTAPCPSDLLSPDPSSSELPDVLAGPIIRRVTPSRLVFWMAASRSLDLELFVAPVGQNENGDAAGGGADGEGRSIPLDGVTCRRLPIGRHAVIHLIDIPLDSPLPEDRLIDYDLRIRNGNGETTGVESYAPHLLHDGERFPRFVIKSRLDSILHGSCRRPHYPSRDGMAGAADWLESRRGDAAERPAVLLLTGDQIYADDVACPMLGAIHALISRLGLFDETLEGSVVPDSQALYQAADTYYHRDQLLPAMEATITLRERLFGGVEKPVFTTTSAENHLITLAEVLAMYLLVWSPVCWTLISPEEPVLRDGEHDRYKTESDVIGAFVGQLGDVARLLAQVPTVMIFDDHDVTDDWNLTADWEDLVYGHPFSRRIIGNAMTAYLICQAWGNAPEKLTAPTDRLSKMLDQALDNDGWIAADRQDALIDYLLTFRQWDFSLPTTPKLLVLDTRTRRWRRENNPKRPSGLMDWEALSEFQQELLDNDSIVIVSPAPMFGVKLIEGIQRLFILAGHPLMVDAENWMAHRGAANTMLNIFLHSRTPGNYVILSGDVHYSFAYDVRIRDRERGPSIWQITSSGIKNEFPRTLLDWFDRLNRWLYAPWSPLNWLTKRRRMQVTPRIPDRARTSERLWNGAGMGLVRLDKEGRPSEISEIVADGSIVTFPPRDDTGARDTPARRR